jgi:hypothetical protein
MGHQGVFASFVSRLFVVRTRKDIYQWINDTWVMTKPTLHIVISGHDLILHEDKLIPPLPLEIRCHVFDRCRKRCMIGHHGQTSLSHFTEHL